MCVCLLVFIVDKMLLSSYMFFFLFSIHIFIFGFYYIQAGAKVNISAGGATPLHIAADNGSLELINCLLKAGADPNVSDEVSQILIPLLYLFDSSPPPVKTLGINCQ